MDKLDSLLQDYFGFDHFRPGQKALVQAVLDGRDALGILPTGSGKTLCYQLPALVMPGLCVVVEPLLALMDDQVARLQNAGQKQVVTLSSRLTPPDFQWLLRHLDQAKFLFVAPETLMRPDVLARLSELSISCLVIDEAHCIAQWGPDFRPAYLRLGEAIQRLNPRSCLALTATAPKRVQEEIVSQLHLQAPELVISSVDRPNIFLGVNQVASPADKQQVGMQLIQQVKAATIVYFDAKVQAETWAKALQAQDIAADFYHAGLSAQQRELIQRRFMAGDLQVICATSAFGMGIDKADVRLVMYTYAPESLEAYSQGIGRAGRDGKNSASVVLLAPGDLSRQAQFAQSLPDAQLIKTIYAHPDAYVDFDDPQIALLQAYVQSGFSQQQVQQLLAQRAAEKLTSAQAVATYLTSSGCKRAMWLHYFDAPATAHHDQCCGELLSPQIEALAGSTWHTPQKNTWRSDFARLFNEL
ncbi:RecQ family ATP-dependent DNA helicase [Lacticaseibacillus porcinae]|uniref:RecQ family ATP-dependent DNA helicase n=1 Tax=Lacticaseibacillus porcinae TaxID=1123687 RepID=UPI000F7701E6|nr:RecQ family ATP-dependent DNA helicase [Lacticaseibacillus porcinae]